MCTAVTYKSKDHYFGRNLDLEYSYKESVTITPRNYIFNFRKLNRLETHFAIIGMAYISDGYPLYYDATNEKGLSIAGLNFPDNADYKPYCAEKDNVAPFELIPWILGQCASVDDACSLLKRINLLNESFSSELPLSPLHWIISDNSCAITVETLKGGMRIYENPVGILTNNPPFDFHMYHLINFLNLTSDEPENRFSDKVAISPYSRGMGAIGLPGDLSSSSRFIRAAFTKLNSYSGDDEIESVEQFFHILGSVEQQRGCVKVGTAYEKTVYSSCCNTDKGVYYYTTYGNRRITAVDMTHEDLEGKSVISYPLRSGPDFLWEN